MVSVSNLYWTHLLGRVQCSPASAVFCWMVCDAHLNQHPEIAIAENEGRVFARLPDEAI